MIVIADTSPLQYLVLIGEDWILPRLFQRVLAPREVWEELTADGAPRPVREWASAHPKWLQIEQVNPQASSPIPELDSGEEAAIRLAQQIDGVSFLLMDDAKGRKVAGRLGMRTTGTLGVLLSASKAGLLSLRTVLPRLLETNFYINSDLVTQLLDDERSRDT